MLHMSPIFRTTAAALQLHLRQTGAQSNGAQSNNADGDKSNVERIDSQVRTTLKSVIC